MKLLNIHNIHAHPGGMEIVFEALTALFKSRGHDVVELAKSNADLKSTWQKLMAFGGAIYSRSVYREITDLLQRERPAVAHVHNLYPQLSTSALDALYEQQVPVILHTGDYKLSCPTAQHLRHGKICEKCVGGHEYWAAIHNCRNSHAMSVAYSLRNMWARVSQSVVRGVSIYACPTRFVADMMIRAGFPKDRVRVVYNFCDLPDVAPRNHAGEYVGYLGRISPEKGLDVLIAAARKTGLKTKIAGDPSLMPQLQVGLPSNVEFVGKLKHDHLDEFLDGMRVLVVPSVWYEVFGLVCVEALSRGIPVIASDIGGLPEVVHHKESGLLVPAGDVDALAEAMQLMADNPEWAMALGMHGHEVAHRLFTPEAFYRHIRELWSEICIPTEVRAHVPLAGPKSVAQS
ncbi:MAG: glycosyltransferase [Burkholderiales bacterium]|nr:glycosyltransferase [Phycisphaerae bacterium]